MWRDFILGIPGQQSSKAYIQAWLGSASISDSFIRKIFACAGKVKKVF
jgi:hypothetical protein